MSRGLRLKNKIAVHNKHHFVVTDCRTGAIKQEAWAYNIILNRGLKMLIDNFDIGAGSSFYVTGSPTAPFVSCYLGKGTGTLDRDRTALFDSLGYLVSSEYEKDTDIDAMSCEHTRRTVFDETLYQNEVITEVGLGSNDGMITTHALIEDSEGNPITINKGLFDIVTVYSTIYFDFSHTYGSNMRMVRGTRDWAGLLAYYSNEYTHGFYSNDRFRVHFGRNNDAPVEGDEAVKTSIFTSATLVRTNLNYDDVAYNFDFTYRLTASNGNHADGIWEIGLACMLGLTSANSYPTLRMVFPINVLWEGYDVEGEELGTGDGVQDTFDLQWSPIVAESETIKVNDVVQVRGTDYTINNTTGQIVFESGSIPAEGHSVVGDYRVLFIPKDTNHVLDVTMEFQYADGNA